MDEFLKNSFGENYSLPIIVIYTVAYVSFYFQIFMFLKSLIRSFFKFSLKSKKFYIDPFKEIFIAFLIFVNISFVKENVFPLIPFFAFFRFLLYSCTIIVDVIPKNKFTALTFFITFCSLLITFFTSFNKINI